MVSTVSYFIVKKIYGDHNDSPAVRATIKKLLADMPIGAVGLNVGAGRTRIDPRIRNMEITEGEGIDIIGSVEAIPCDDSMFDLVIAQEVLEHVRTPALALREMHRVLRPRGFAYVQLPFVIGYHPCPHDYWRFSHEGIRHIVESADFEITELGQSVGPAVGFYRVLVEFVATLASLFGSFFYRPVKLASAIGFYPIKWLDPIMKRSSQANRIAGGYFVVCRKR